jgi:hypothetical protein
MQIKKQPELWAKLQAFSLDNPEAKFNFTQRLCRENGWNLNYATRAIEEYKKFLYLSYITKKSLTPSDEVDQVWHLHMIYTESYWKDLCKGVFNYEFHHGPTKGGKQESTKYGTQYNFTLDFYIEVFGCNAPADIWPDVKIRFSNVCHQRVNMHQNIVLNKRKVKEYMLSYALVPFLAVISSLFVFADEIDWPAVLLWVGGIILVIFIIRGIYRYINREDREDKNKGGGSGGSGSSSNNGCTVASSFFGCSSSGCSSSSSSHGCSSSSSSGCSSGSSGCGSSGCGGGGGCGGCGG